MTTKPRPYSSRPAPLSFEGALGKLQNQPSQLIFLPGALGDLSLWHPVAHRLSHGAERVFMGYPGFWGVPADPSIGGLGDLARRLAERITQPTALIAQSMGGVVAILGALERLDLVTHLVKKKE